ncbi:MAG: hypothetical protein GY856_40400 [bacterium]|nr:hypothetical protein [bacterium]
MATLAILHDSPRLLGRPQKPPPLSRMGGRNYDWKEWFFNVSPRGFWHDPKNVRRFLDWLGEELGFQSMEDWYQLTIEDVAYYRGHTLLNKYNSSLVKIVPHYFPEYDWEIWKFRRPSEAFWGEPDHCRRYLEWLGKELGFEKSEDWYQLRSTDFTRNHGAGLLNQFNRSLSAVLKAHMPEVDWKEWLFYIPPRRIWSDRETRRRYLEWLAEILGIRDADDWGRLRCKHITGNRGAALVRCYKYSVRNILLDTFPADHPAVRGIPAGQRGRGFRESIESFGAQRLR